MINVNGGRLRTADCGRVRRARRVRHMRTVTLSLDRGRPTPYTALPPRLYYPLPRRAGLARRARPRPGRGAVSSVFTPGPRSLRLLNV